MEGEGGLEGTMLGRYRLDRFLGEGATSQVYLATHTQLGRRVAIKVLSPRLLLGREGIDRVIQEARVVNSVRHPNIAEIFDVVESDAPLRMALVMEYVEGPSLGALGSFTLSIDQAIGVSLQLVSALQTTHAAGVIHRDLKPENMLFTRDPRKQPPSRVPRLKVIDFGVAKLGSHGKTVAGRMVGTPAYMAPEQVAGSPPASPATDVFAVGEIVYEMLAGERAFPQSTVQAVVRAKLRGPKPELAKLRTLPDTFRVRLEPLLHRCLASGPEERPGLDELREALIELVPWREASGPAEAKVALALHEPQTVPWMEAIEDDPVEAALARPKHPSAESSSDGPRPPRAPRDLARRPPPPAAATDALASSAEVALHLGAAPRPVIAPEETRLSVKDTAPEEETALEEPKTTASANLAWLSAEQEATRAGARPPTDARGFPPPVPVAVPPPAAVPARKRPHKERFLSPSLILAVLGGGALAVAVMYAIR